MGIACLVLACLAYADDARRVQTKYEHCHARARRGKVGAHRFGKFSSIESPDAEKFPKGSVLALRTLLHRIHLCNPAAAFKPSHACAYSSKHSPSPTGRRTHLRHAIEMMNPPFMDDEPAEGSPVDLVQQEEMNRFELVPANGWNHFVEPIGCNASNLLEWYGETPVPRTSHPCWLLPVKDDMAVTISQMQRELREAGWKLLTCDPGIVATLGNKSSLREHAEKIGMLHHMPVHYDSWEDAHYPCVLKAAKGDHGKNIWIIKTPEEVDWFTSAEHGAEWILQELIQGCIECSTSLLVVEGKIIDAICTEYEYSSSAYIWPNNVYEMGKKFPERIPAYHLNVMSAFLKGFSGICNFNYKFRMGQLVIFEVNPRVGGDLVFDVPKDRARALFEKLDTISAREQAAGSVEHQHALLRSTVVPISTHSKPNAYGNRLA